MADESDSHGIHAADLRTIRDKFAQAPDDPAARLEFGRLLAGLGRTQAALRHFQHAAVDAPEQADGHRSVARTLYALGRHADSVEPFRRAVALDPSEARDWLMLGVALRLTRRAGEAKECLEKSLGLDGTSAEGWYELGLALENLGHWGEARSAQQRALQADPRHVPARATEVSLAARDAAEREPPRIAPGKVERVAFHMNKVFHYSILRPLFDAFRQTHRVLFTADAINLVYFDPDAVVVCDAQAKNLRPLLPRALFVNVSHGAAPTKRYFETRVAAHVDYTCVHGEAIKKARVEAGVMEAARIWVTGFVPMDPLFRGRALPPPFPVASGRKVVLFAPTYNPHLSAAPMLGKKVATLIRGDRDDVTVVVKPHPLTVEQNPLWMSWWREIAARDSDFRLVDDPAADIAPYLQAADALVSDVSTVAFAYLALDRPIILLANPERARDRESFDPNGLEWRCRDMAADIGDPAALPAAVDRALRRPDEGAERRRYHRDMLFGGCQDGRAVERIHRNISALAKV